jgi:2'-5' RNA ligase
MRETQKAISSNCKNGVERQVVSSLVSRRTSIAYWLIPTEPAHSCFQKIINDLARRFDGPVFEPHMTIHVGPDNSDPASRAIGGAAHECARITLTTTRVDHSAQFTKTLFVEFAMTTNLRQLRELICNTAHDSAQYQLKPHLSLLYKKMPAETRRDLAASIKIPFQKVTFGAIKAVRCISPTESRVDVEAWRVMETTSLREG